MAWTRKNKKEFRKALQGVYRDYGRLKIFVAEEMGWQLENIVASNQTLDTVSFEVIAWAEGNSALQELYEAFREENPNHPFKLQTPAKPQPPAQPAPPPAPVPEPTPAPKPALPGEPFTFTTASVTSDGKVTKRQGEGRRQ
ncbi:MAG: effector-associated domain EAD1-containing protein, partial [Cyanobacteria bacterium P01_F01_bin.153]